MMFIFFYDKRFFTRLRDASTERRNKAKTPEPAIAAARDGAKVDAAKSKNLAAKNIHNVRLSPVITAHLRSILFLDIYCNELNY